MQERSLMGRGGGKKSSTLSPQQKSEKKVRKLESTLSLLYIQCEKIQR